MEDEISKTRAWFEMSGGEEGGGAYLAQLGHLLVPGHKDPIMHLLQMSRLTQAKARDTVILLNEHFRTSTRWRNYPKTGIDWWSLDEGARLALLSAAASNAVGGAGRGDLVHVLMGAVRVIRNAGSRMNPFRKRGGAEGAVA